MMNNDKHPTPHALRASPLAPHPASPGPRSPLIRVGAVQFLLGLPLVYGLQREQPSGIELEFDVPSALADRLERGELDVALIPAVEFFRPMLGSQVDGPAPTRYPEARAGARPLRKPAGLPASPGLLAVPGLCVACDGPVESIRLFHARPLHEVRRVALDLSSRTAMALVRVLFERFWGILPEYFDHPPDLALMLGQADAALIIGDNALAVGADVPYVDGGAEWKRQTGLPFVFALWGVRSELALRLRSGQASEAPRIEQILQESYARGKENLEQIATEQAAARGMDRERVARYLGQSIHYELTEEKLRGLSHFRKLGMELGIFPPDGPELTFLPSGGSEF